LGIACTICQHPEREAIDHALVAGVSVRGIACQWHVGRESVRRHLRRHVSPALAAMQAEREHEGATSLLNRVESLIGRTETLLECAEQDGKVSAALAAVRELRGLLELLGKVSGELDTRPQVTINLMASEEYIAVRSAIFAALMQYPDARAAVAGRLLQLEAGPS
jgi:hypothetical protein